MRSIKQTGKLDLLNYHLSSEFDIAVISETWLTEKISFKNQHYALFFSKFNKRRGVSVLIKKSFSCKLIEVDRFEDCIVMVEVSLLGDKAAIVIGVYVPPEQKTEFLVYLRTVLLRVRRRFISPTIVLAGDFNMEPRYMKQFCSR